jgi:hypothetical protein
VISGEWSPVISGEWSPVISGEVDADCQLSLEARYITSRTMTFLLDNCQAAHVTIDFQRSAKPVCHSVPAVQHMPFQPVCHAVLVGQHMPFTSVSRSRLAVEHMPFLSVCRQTSSAPAVQHMPS